MNLLIQLLANGVVNGAVFAVLACAFGLVYRSLEVFTLPLGVFLIPPYVVFAARFWLNAPVGLAVSFGLMAGLVVGYLIERLLYGPLALRKASSAAVLVASLGAYVVLENVFAVIFGNDTRTIQNGLVGQLHFGLISLAYIQVLQLSICAVTLAGLAAAIERVKEFKVFWAMGDEPELIPILGLPLTRFCRLVFTLSAGLGGSLDV